MAQIVKLIAGTALVLVLGVLPACETLDDWDIEIELSVCDKNSPNYNKELCLKLTARKPRRPNECPPDDPNYPNCEDDGPPDECPPDDPDYPHCDPDDPPDDQDYENWFIDQFKQLQDDGFFPSFVDVDTLGYSYTTSHHPEEELSRVLLYVAPETHEDWQAIVDSDLDALLEELEFPTW